MNRLQSLSGKGGCAVGRSKSEDCSGAGDRKNISALTLSLRDLQVQTEREEEGAEEINSGRLRSPSVEHLSSPKVVRRKSFGNMEATLEGAEGGVGGGSSPSSRVGGRGSFTTGGRISPSNLSPRSNSSTSPANSSPLYYSSILTTSTSNKGGGGSSDCDSTGANPAVERTRSSSASHSPTSLSSSPMGVEGTTIFRKISSDGKRVSFKELGEGVVSAAASSPAQTQDV